LKASRGRKTLPTRRQKEHKRGGVKPKPKIRSRENVKRLKPPPPPPPPHTKTPKPKHFFVFFFVFFVFWCGVWGCWIFCLLGGRDKKQENGTLLHVREKLACQVSRPPKGAPATKPRKKKTRWRKRGGKGKRGKNKKGRQPSRSCLGNRCCVRHRRLKKRGFCEKKDPRKKRGGKTRRKDGKKENGRGHLTDNVRFATGGQKELKKNGGGNRKKGKGGKACTENLHATPPGSLPKSKKSLEGKKPRYLGFRLKEKAKSNGSTETQQQHVLGTSEKKRIRKKIPRGGGREKKKGPRENSA